MWVWETKVDPTIFWGLPCPNKALDPDATVVVIHFGQGEVLLWDLVMEMRP